MTEVLAEPASTTSQRSDAIVEQIVPTPSGLANSQTQDSPSAGPSGAASEQATRAPVMTNGADASKDPFMLFRNAALTFSNIPAIYQRHRPGSPNVVAHQVPDWRMVKQNRHQPPHRQIWDNKEIGNDRSSPKTSKVNKAKGLSSGRTYTSKYRGVHQTFPTRRWEAQFRRNGKPTSLGCFDEEEQAARAYDKMMLWCELHNTSGLKGGGITNFDPTEYEKDLLWLNSISQEELVQASRSEGRRQTAHGKAQRVITPEARRERMRMQTRRRNRNRRYSPDDDEDDSLDEDEY
ncbi:g204 [Coccomyxa elongata]